MPITRNHFYGCIQATAINSFAMPHAAAPRNNGCSCGEAAGECLDPPHPCPPVPPLPPTPVPPAPPVLPLPSLEGQLHPRDIGAKAWTYDPMFVEFPISQGGFIYLSKIFIHKPTTVTSIIFLASGQGPLTPGQNFAGIYTASGQLVAASQDQSVNWHDKKGYIRTPIPPTQLMPGAYFIAFLSNGENGSVGALGREICGIQGVLPGFESYALQTALSDHTVLPPQFVLSDFTSDFTCHYLWAALA